MTTWKRIGAECLGTAYLLAVIVGSGVMAERLAAGNEAVALLANALATGAGLVVILLTVGPVSGAHLNPLVSVMLAVRGELAARELPGYLIAQMLGAMLGVLATHAMFGLPLLEMSVKARSGMALAWSEFVATFGLLAVILSVSRSRPSAVPFAVGAYITAAYWFTASTSFANPAVSLARAMTDTFTGIRLSDVPGFVIAQVSALLIILLAMRSCFEERRK